MRLSGPLFSTLTVTLALAGGCVGGTNVTSESESESESGEPTTSTTSGPTTQVPTGTGMTTGSGSESGVTMTLTTTESTEGTQGTTDSDGTTESTGSVPSTCSRVGGEEGLSALHTSFLAGVLVDERINGYFLNSNVDGPGLIECLSEQVGAEIGCPGVIYTCMDMKIAHTGMGISSVDFADLLDDYSVALDDHQAEYPEVTDDDKAAIMAALGGMEGAIVEDVDNVKTIYQRLGRKPAFKALIGDPDTADSFINIVAADNVINGFFADADFVRLGTCFTRQLASIDGPVKYTKEVDSPGEGVDEGVSAATPCVDMLTSHDGLKDSKDDALITMMDFTQVLSDMISAMDAAGIAEGEQLALLGVLGPMCEDIVGDHPNECPGNNESMSVTASGVDIPIPDDGYDGSKASMACATLQVMDNGINLVDEVEVTVGIDHTWLGDLTIKVYSPEGTAITLLSRAGFSELSDNGTGVSVEGSDLSAVTAITFAGDEMKDAEGIGNNLDNNGVVCQDDGLCDFLPNSGKATPGGLDTLQGETATGTWSVCAGDAGSSDAGTLVDVSMKLKKVKFME